MAWGGSLDNGKKKKKDLNGGFNSVGPDVQAADAEPVVILPPKLTLEAAKRRLQKKGVELKDAKDGDWIVIFEKEEGLLFERADIVYVYTKSGPESPFGKLLTKSGIAFSSSPKGGWAED